MVAPRARAHTQRDIGVVGWFGVVCPVCVVWGVVGWFVHIYTMVGWLYLYAWGVRMVWGVHMVTHGNHYDVVPGHVRMVTMGVWLPRVPGHVPYVTMAHRTWAHTYRDHNRMCPGTYVP
jgi:hypothetical protein